MRLFIASIFLFGAAAVAAPIEVKCELQKNLDDFLDMPETLSYFRDGKRIYMKDEAGEKVECKEDKALGLNAILCGTSDEGLYFVSKGAWTLLLDAETFSALGSYTCQSSK